MSQSKKIAVQMDPIESIDIKTDSTILMIMEAQERGYSIYHYQPEDLTLKNGTLTARARALSIHLEESNHFKIGDSEIIKLYEVDVILMRQDPPFDMSYITATHLLEQVHPKTLVVNNPISVRNSPEKIFTTLFPDLMPPTLITRDSEAIRTFRNENKDVIIKPLYGNGGYGVFHIPQKDDNLGALLQIFKERSREPIMVQAYLENIRKGDKRIILIDGKAAGAINRIPPEGDVRANMHSGGTPHKSKLTNRELEICEIIGPELKRLGLIFTGIDVIDGYLTEINVTSPTGLQEINKFNNVKLEASIWDAIEMQLI